MADLKGKVIPTGVPDAAILCVLAAVQKALVELRIPTHNVVTISGNGSLLNFPGYMNTYACTSAWPRPRRGHWTEACQS